MSSLILVRDDDRCASFVLLAEDLVIRGLLPARVVDHLALLNGWGAATVVLFPARSILAAWGRSRRWELSSLFRT